MVMKAWLCQSGALSVRIIAETEQDAVQQFQTQWGKPVEYVQEYR